MTPSARKIHAPVNDGRVLTQVAQSEFAYATAVVASCCGRFDRSRSDLLLFIVGGGPSGRLSAVVYAGSICYCCE